jgi:hypothetical protein
VVLIPHLATDTGNCNPHVIRMILCIHNVTNMWLLSPITIRLKLTPLNSNKQGERSPPMHVWNLNDEVPWPTTSLCYSFLIATSLHSPVNCIHQKKKYAFNMITSTIYLKFPFSTSIPKYIWRHKVGYFKVQVYRPCSRQSSLKVTRFSIRHTQTRFRSKQLITNFWLSRNNKTRY